MPISGTTIVAPVRGEDPYILLGVPKQSSGYDVGYICGNSHGRINMWSRFKPVHIANAFEVDRNSQWWKGTDGDCGINLDNANTTNYKGIKGKYELYSNNGWEYKPPWGDRGGIVKSPFRLLDFLKYKHDAAPPIESMFVPSTVKKDGLLRVDFSIRKPDTDNAVPGSIYFDDITPVGITKPLNSFYLGIVVYHGSSFTEDTFKGRVTSTSTGVGSIVEFSVIGLTMGNTYQVYPFLAEHPMTQSQTDIMNNYYTLPNIKMKEFKVVSSEVAEGLTLVLHAEYLYILTEKVSITYTISLTSSTNRTLRNNHLQMRFSEHKPSDILIAGEKTKNLGDIDLYANVLKSIKGTFTLDQPSKMYYLYLTLDTGRYTKQVYPLQAHP